MQLRQLKQQLDSDLPKYEEIFPESDEHNNNSVQIYVIRSEQQHQQQPYLQNPQYRHHHQQQQQQQQQQPVELNDRQLSRTSYQPVPQSVMELNNFVYRQQLYHLQNAQQQPFLSCRQQQQHQQQLPLVHQVQQAAQNQIPIENPL